MKQETYLIQLKGADLPYLENLLLFWLRACLKKAFCKMCVTICGRFCPDEGAVAGYGNRIRAKYTAKWGVQIAGMIFQIRSNLCIPDVRCRNIFCYLLFNDYKELLRRLQ